VGLVVGFDGVDFCAGSVYMLRFLGGRWKSMRVIEPSCGVSVDYWPEEGRVGVVVWRIARWRWVGR